MYNCAAIKQANHTNEKYWYFPLRAIFIFWTGSLQQHDISRAPGHMVPSAQSPWSSCCYRESVMKCGQDQGVGSRVLGAGNLGEVLNYPVYLYLCDWTTSIFLPEKPQDMQPYGFAPVTPMKTLCANSETAPSVDWLAHRLLTSMFVCLSPCVFVLCWEQGGDKFSTLAPDWRQWPFILHCPT